MLTLAGWLWPPRFLSSLNVQARSSEHLQHLLECCLQRFSLPVLLISFMLGKRSVLYPMQCLAGASSSLLLCVQFENCLDIHRHISFSKTPPPPGGLANLRLYFFVRLCNHLVSSTLCNKTLGAFHHSLKLIDDGVLPFSPTAYTSRPHHFSCSTP